MGISTVFHSPNHNLPNATTEPFKSLQRYQRSDAKWALAVVRGADLHIKNQLEYRRVIKSLSPLHIAEGSAANPSVRQRFRSLVCEALGPTFFESLKHGELGALTIVDKLWWTSDRDFHFDRDRASRQIRNFLRNHNYLGIWEFANIINWRPQGGIGRVVSPHAHILIWGESCRTIRPRLKKRNEKDAWFQAPFNPFAAVRLDALSTADDLTRVLCYTTKSPLMAYRVRPVGNDRFKLYRTQNTYAGHLRIYGILDSFNLSELMFAGGEGVAIARQIRDEFRRRGMALTRK